MCECVRDSDKKRECVSVRLFTSVLNCLFWVGVSIIVRVRVGVSGCESFRASVSVRVCRGVRVSGPLDGCVSG